ncbi:hypothetical protein BRD14_02495 [Halobacteriales archaeon SW_5_68_122]|nr:MAG: hypothetical protein BRD14_02495 [Halobacteriales archaeon SW_5_68_122]
MQPDPNEPVEAWPLEGGDPGREVWYSLVSPRDGSVAFWYRYTLLSTESGYQEGRLWAALTDREAPENSTFVSAAFPFEEVWADADSFELTVGNGVLTSSSATGSVNEVAWDLEYDPDSYAFTPLRSETLTDLLSAALGTGKHWSRNESVSMSGEVTVGDRTVELEDAPGHQGHTVSSTTPPEQWTWVQCNDFEEDDSAVLEALRLDDKLSLCFRVDGEVYPLNRLPDVLPASPSANVVEHDEVGHWRFRGEGEGIELQATVESPDDHWQTVSYMVPDDGLRYNAHCSLSTVTVTYSVDDGPARNITSDAARAEWVSDEPPIKGEYEPKWE